MTIGRRVCFAFTLAHLTVVLAWALPQTLDFAPPWNIRAKLNALSAPYLVNLGLWQGWDMFAPNPRSERLYVTCQIRFADNSVRTFEIPRMEKLTLAERYRFEGIRKWSNDHLRTDAKSDTWPETSLWLLKELAPMLTPASPTHVPVEVSLIRHWSVITAPPRPITWQHYTFYKRAVSPADWDLARQGERVMPLPFNEVHAP